MQDKNAKMLIASEYYPNVTVMNAQVSKMEDKKGCFDDSSRDYFRKVGK